jgi:hypothetical protein
MLGAHCAIELVVTVVAVRSWTGGKYWLYIGRITYMKARRGRRRRRRRRRKEEEEEGE